MLEIRGLCAGYGRAQMLSGLDLAVHAGEAVALLGRNGAGKSTALKACMGLVAVFAGQIAFAGRELVGLAPYEIARLGLGYVPEGRRVFADLTVAENLEAGRRPARPGATGWSPARLYELFPALGRLRGRRGGSLSGGEQQMLALSRTLMGNPVVLLLDEPFEGLGPLVAGAIQRALGELKREGLALLLSDQNLRLARRLADRACILESGRMRFGGTLGELDADPAVLARHLAV